jgi:hypothetical protein
MNKGGDKMSRISLELVPDPKQIENGIHHLQSIVSGVSAINIPGKWGQDPFTHLP